MGADFFFNHGLLPTRAPYSLMPALVHGPVPFTLCSQGSLSERNGEIRLILRLFCPERGENCARQTGKHADSFQFPGIFVRVETLCYLNNTYTHGGKTGAYGRDRMPASTPQDTIPSNSAQAARTAGIEFSQVTKRYGANTVVDNLTLSIPAGETTVFVGSSGCGKTTTLRMINRMVEPQEGTTTIGGQNIADQDPYKLRRSIGYVMQSGGLLPHRTVLENVMTVPLLNGTPKPQAKERALDLLGTVGLDASLAQRYPAQLSGGQAQRVGVARALAADASILLMDEPFSAVDPIVRTELQEELLRLQGELHKTIVFVTHDIDEALFLGDNIAVFAPGGKLAQYGAPEEILTNPANDFVESFVSQSVGALLPADVMRQVRYIRRERYRRTREAAASGEGAASTSGRG